MLNKSPLKPYIYVIFILIPIMTLSRVALVYWQQQRVDAVDGWLPILLQGIRVDIASLCMLLILPMLVSSILSGPIWLMKLWHKLVTLWLALIVFTVIFMELATPSFIIEYNIRPNRLFIEYLIYPKEVFSMLLKSHLGELILSSTVCFIAAIYTWKISGKILKHSQQINWSWRPMQLLIVLFFMALGARSTLGHRPLNPAMVYFSNDPLVNSLVLNSFYSTAYAAKQMLAEESAESPYGYISEKIIIETIRDFKGLTNQATLNPLIPTLAVQKASYRGKPKNLVIVLEESLGARFVGSLGGLPLTPSFDGLSQEGWFFDSMLATGTRSVRGIEAVITGFSPTPDRAVVKLDKSQKDFFTIAQLLKNKGYHTEFIYGGEAHFDNMKSFFLGNGFQVITEEKNYINPVFTGSWGVSDEDLFNKADQRFTALKKANKAFFSLLFTSSNHIPFEYPDGRIEAYEKTHDTRNNAIKYADFALGEFFKKVKQSNYWEDTVFLIIADHDANAHGKSLVPPKSFHIPALILAKDILIRRDSMVRSQLDMPPTLLSLIGIDNENPMIGHDLTQIESSAENRALMQYGDNFALLEGGNMTILQPGKSAKSFFFNKNTFSLLGEGTELSKEDTNRALAISSWGKYAYSHQLYHLPK